MATLDRPIPLLRFTKAGRIVLIYSTNAAGTELRCDVDGAFAWSRTCRTDDDLRAEVDSIRADLLARGWFEVLSANA